MARISRRLADVFGVRDAEFTAAHMRSLVDNGISESFDLDFKRDPYGGSESERRKLAGDVAALANTAGGVIVIGIDEDDQARASAAPGIELSDAEVGRMRQIVGSNVSPLPQFDVILVPNSPPEDILGGEPATRGFLVVVVTPSIGGPHAVLINEALRYPRRNGSTTRYLTEPEVAEAYRVRLAGLANTQARLDQVWNQGLARLNTTEQTFVAVALVPDVPGEFTIDHSTFLRFQQEATGSEPTIVPVGVRVQRARVGQGRLSADATLGAVEPRARSIAYDLHTDGAGFFACRAGERRGNDPYDMAQSVSVHVELLTVAVLSGLTMLAQHARDRAGTSGSVLLRAGIHEISSDKTTEIIYSYSGFHQPYGESVTNPPAPVETSALLDDLVPPGPALISTAAALCHGIGQAFGVPELGQLSRSGELRRRYFADLRQPITAWAESHGIEMTDEQLP